MLATDVLDRCRDVADAVAGAGRADPRHEGHAGRRDELIDRRRRAADDERPGGVAVPAVDDRADVDRHDLAVTDDPIAGDAMDDLAVDRDAGARREGRRATSLSAAAGIALEGRDPPGRPDVLLGEAVQLAGRDAGAELLLDEGQDFGDDTAGTTHLLHLPARLPGDHASGPPRGAGVDRFDGPEKTRRDLADRLAAVDG